MMKRVLVIVVTYNGMQWIDRCLSSVVKEADVYVWDNDSTDGTPDYVISHFPEVSLTRSADNLGFSVPNNKGMEYALVKGYDYVYLLNQDAWLEAGALLRMVQEADSHPQYGVLSPMQYAADGVTLDAQFSRCLSSRKPSAVLSVKRVMAAHWLVPTEVIRRIGPFEEKLFPLWGQDDDWCHLLRYNRLKVGVVQDARAVHDRAYREEPLEKVVRRNYYTGSLVRLCNVNCPLVFSYPFVLLFTLVKAVKYRSVLPFRYFRIIGRDFPKIRERRRLVRARSHKRM